MEFVLEMLTQGLERVFSGDAAVWETVWRTLWLAVQSTGIALVLGLLPGVWLGEARTRARRTGLAVANAGLGLPPVVLGVFLAVLLLPSSLLGPLDLTYTLTAIVIAQTLLALPIVIALTAAAVGGLPTGLLDQARAFGASWPRRAALALREAWIGIVAAVIAAFGSAIAEVGAVVIVGGNVRGTTNTLASTVLLDLSAADTAGATAMVLVLLAVVLVAGLLLSLLQHRVAR